MLNRRQLLTAAASSAALAAGPSWLHALGARRDGARRIVLVVLAGGNDGLNTLAPVGDDVYHRARPTLALARGDVIALDEHQGFHPSLRRMAARFEAGGLGIVQSVGTKNSNLSHFRAMDVWESAQPELASPDSGWLGRLADAVVPRPEPGSDAGPLAGSSSAAVFAPLLSVGRVATPLALRARTHDALAVPGRDDYRVRFAPDDAEPGRARALRRAVEQINRTGGDGSVARTAQAFAASSNAIAQLERALATPRPTSYPESSIARQLEVCARVIEHELGAICLHATQGGYDTHARQADAHAGLLADLDAALHAFLEDLARTDRLDRTLVLVVSEFGRRVAENGVAGLAGTDHGAAGLVLLAGGTSVPGLHGERPKLDALDANGNLDALVDFRRIYADVAEGWFGVPSARVLGTTFERAGVIA